MAFIKIDLKVEVLIFYVLNNVVGIDLYLITYFCFNVSILFYMFYFFVQAKNWVKELRKMLGDSCVLCIVGNKIDLEKNRTVSAREAEE